MSDPVIAMGVCANMFVRQIYFESASDAEQGHKHEFDHMTLVAKGKVLVEIDDKTTEFTAPAMIYIRAEIVHKITALTDNSVIYCIHPLRDANKSGDIIAPDMVPNGSELREILNNMIVR
jgi:quercetin dioxygenase-like cupin family protein